MRTHLAGMGLAILIFVFSGCEKTEELYVLGTSAVPRSWGTAVILKALQTSLGAYPSLAMDASGNAVAIWAILESGAESSLYSARMVRGVWGAPQLIENLSGYVLDCRVALNASGVGVAIWRDSQYVYANRMTSDGQWGTPQQIDKDGEMNDDLQVSIDAAGNALAIWSIGDGIVCNRMDPSGDWEDTHDNVLPSLGQIDYLKMAMNPRGEAVVAWSQWMGGVYNIYACRVVNGAWGTPQLLENQTDHCYNQDVAIDDLGNAIVVWRTNNDIYACRWTGGSWEAPVALDDPAQTSYDGRVAMTGNGNAIAIWTQYDGLRGSIAARRLVSGTWQGLEWVENENGGNAEYPSLASDGRGNAVVVWKQNDGTGYSIWANEFTGGSWGTAWYIETSTSSVGIPFLAMSSDGSAVAVWPQHNGSVYDLWANRYR